MKRDWNLVRKLTFYIRDNDFGKIPISSENSQLLEYFGKDGYSRNQIEYHLALMNDDEFFIGTLSGRGSSIECWLIYRLTSIGHTFAEEASSDRVWETVQVAMKPVGTISLAVLQALLMVEVKKLLGLP